MADNKKIVLDFIASWSSGDPERIGAFLTDDCFYHNIPLEPIRGRKAIVDELGRFFQLLGPIQVRTLHCVAEGAVVLTERIDSFHKGEKRLDLPVMGTFELTADGRISHWRDYFDMAPVTSFAQQ